MLNGPPMRFLSSSFVLAAVMAVLLWSGAARAQSVSGINGIATRYESDGTTPANVAHPHPTNIPDTSVNFADCEADLKIKVQLSVVGPFNNVNLQAWVGSTDCSLLTARQTPATCWRVSSLISNAVNPQVIDVRVQDILTQLNATTKDFTQVVAGSEADCHTQTSTGSTALSIYFFFANSQGQPVGSAQAVPINVDTLAAGVGTIDIEVGSGILYVKVPTTTDTDTKGWNVYCDPPKDPNADAAFEASTTTTTPTTTCDASTTPVTSPTDAATAGDTTDGGVTDGAVADASAATDSSTTTASCPDASTSTSTSGSIPAECHASNVLASGGSTVSVTEAGTEATGGVQKIIPGAFLCGSVDVTSTRIQIEGVTNGTLYDIAVAARDAVGNVGPLSNVACGTPGPIDDFWDDYSKAGGAAGGSCALEGAGMPAGTGALTLGMMAAAIASARRRRRS
jgi:hypothetical protein